MEERLADFERRGILVPSGGDTATFQASCENTGSLGALPSRPWIVSLAYVDSSSLVAVAFNEPGWDALAERLERFIPVSYPPTY